MPYESLDTLYRYFSPTGLSPSGDKSVTVETFYDVVMRCILDPNGTLYSKVEIEKLINDHLTKAMAEEGVEKVKTIGKKYHYISKESVLDLGDKAYWGDVKGLSDVVPVLKKSGGFECVVLAVSDPYTTPAVRGNRKIDLFLNHTPPMTANQMVPYLDVQFDFMKESFDSLSTPSLTRFLMGSVQTKSLTGIDAATVKSSDPDAGNKKVSKTGMELFLMPQTLTNMDGINETTGVRLVKPKPFVPFASIEGLDISIANAGALNYAHKKGTLKFKVHDKSRISEISEFIRGPSGFARAKVWTTYGWIAPMKRGPEDEYCSFINDNMVVKDCWVVINTQFGIDVTGQVSFTLEVVSDTYKMLQELDVGSSSDGDSSKLKELQTIIQEITRIKNESTKGAKLNLLDGDRASQVLNGASASGVLPKLTDKEFSDALMRIKASLRSANPTVSESDLNSLSENITKLRSKEYSYKDSIKTAIQNFVKSKFDAVATGHDPFLPGEKNKEYFGEELIKSIEGYLKKSSHIKRNEVSKGKGGQASAPASEEDEVIVVKLDKGKERNKVVSFGKLFMSFLAPAVKSVPNEPTDQELQVIFYGVNGTCGPLSGRSIAEIPIDVEVLAYAYAEAVKKNRTSVLSLSSFFSLIVATQINDLRGIGYGMSDIYSDFDPTKASGAQLPEDEGKKKAAEGKLSEWSRKWGACVLPQLEFYVESSTTNVPPLRSGNAPNAPSSGKVIRRVHVYDKSHTPHKFANDVINAGGNELVVGHIDDALIRREADELQKKLDNAKREDYDKIINEYRQEKSKPAGGGSKDALAEKSVAGSKTFTIERGKAGLVRDLLKRDVPSITLGTNGTMVHSANLASKTDGLQGTINYMNSIKGTESGKATMTVDGLSELTGMPIRTVPVQLTLSTMGVPIAALYQQYYIDFNTGTSFDNLYTCTQVAHTIGPGKFFTNWTFMYTDGYAKFGNPPSYVDLVIGRTHQRVEEAKKVKKKKAEKAEGAQAETPPAAK
jgi:hypothetical protein